MSITPFRLDVPESILTDLAERLRDTRWPDEIAGSGWDYGTNLDYIKQLVGYWRDHYNWRAHERRLNQLPQFKVVVDGLGIHFVCVKGTGPSPFPLLISHGWPGSFFEMHKVIGPLADPGAHGGDPVDAFDVIVPSLPGYGFSDRPSHRGLNSQRIADLFAKLMTDLLHYRRWGAQGGDWGAVITAHLGYSYPDIVAGIHLNMLTAVGDPRSESDANDVNLWRQQRARFASEGSGYSKIQGTKPQTLAYGLNDSPAGLCAWIVEKFRAWSDCGGDIESIYTKDELLTNVMLYWVTESINSSARLYYEQQHGPPAIPRGACITTPTGVAVFPKEISSPPRRFAERKYNIQHWSQFSSGGHFAALEKPNELVEDIRVFFRKVR